MGDHLANKKRIQHELAKLLSCNYEKSSSYAKCVFIKAAHELLIGMRTLPTKEDEYATEQRQFIRTNRTAYGLIIKLLNDEEDPAFWGWSGELQGSVLQ